MLILKNWITDELIEIFEDNAKLQDIADHLNINNFCGIELNEKFSCIAEVFNESIYISGDEDSKQLIIEKRQPIKL